MKYIHTKHKSPGCWFIWNVLHSSTTNFQNWTGHFPLNSNNGGMEFQNLSFWWYKFRKRRFCFIIMCIIRISKHDHIGWKINWLVSTFLSCIIFTFSFHCCSCIHLHSALGRRLNSSRVIWPAFWCWTSYSPAVSFPAAQQVGPYRHKIGAKTTMLVRLSVRLTFQSLEPKLWGIRKSDRETISPNICQGWIRILRIFLSDPQFWESCPPLSQDSNWRPPEPLSAWSLENKLNAAGTLCSSSWHFHDSLKIGYWYSSHRTCIWKFLPDQVKVVSE